MTIIDAAAVEDHRYSLFDRMQSNSTSCKIESLVRETKPCNELGNVELPEWIRTELDRDPDGIGFAGNFAELFPTIRSAGSLAEARKLVRQCCQSRLTSSAADGNDEKGAATQVWIPSRTLQVLVDRTHHVGVLSSRLGKKLDQYDNWFDALRTLAIQASHSEAALITANGVTTDRFVGRLAELFELPVVTLQSRSEVKRAPKYDGADYPIFICQGEDAEERNAASRKRQQQAHDLWLANAVSLLVVLSVRQGGNVYRAVEQRLDFAELRSGSTRLLIDSELTKRKLSDRLISKGAVGWWLYTCASESVDSGSQQQAVVTVSSSTSDVERLADLAGDEERGDRESKGVANKSEVPILELDEVATIPFLIHWTRRRIGPWPNQLDGEYLDDLLFQEVDRVHHAAASLSRILKTETLLASNQLTRDASPVVCFTDMTLGTFVTKRVFRSHLSRWDFERYGIAFDRDWLQSQGASPVVYGDESTWKSLHPDQRPYFQRTNLGDANEKIDWSQEREWRLVGSLDLNKVPNDAAILFVGSAAEVPAIAAISRWPLVVLDQQMN
ncbi:MAG: abortive infection system antitoxin AbiGi family protein [Planctomycetota bacterium]